VEEDSDEASDSDEEDIPSIAPPPQKINLSGPEPLPRSFASFDELVPSSHSVLLRNLRKDGVTQLWGVQGAVSGAMMAKEQRDVLVIAPTGSGKTLSYLLPLALKLDQPCRIAFNAHKKAESKDAGEQGIRSIVLVPTHELALQIYGEVQKLLQGNTWRTLLLEKSTEMAIAMSGQAGQLGIDVLVATPERLHAMIEAGKVDMKG
jgi:ATP-dependent RNA helicase DDX52/ROK1